MAANDLVMAVTGASGAPYAVRLLETLLSAGRTVHFTMSPAAVEVFTREVRQEINLNAFDFRAFLGPRADAIDLTHARYHHFRDFSAGIASGSFLTGGMVVCPCSMGTVAAIAHGVSENLIHRAADVHLKEKRKLILVPRETPLGLVQLRNLALAAEAGAVVLPAMPAFYTNPRSIDDMIDFIVARICDQFGVNHRLAFRWGQ